MITKKYPIGFWNYTTAGDLGPEAVKDWAELGMTVAFSPIFYEGCDKKAMLALLDESEKYGIKVIVHDSRAIWSGAAGDPEGYEKRFRAAYEDFGHHPAVLGFHAGDEPGNDRALADCYTAHAIQKKVAPELIPHVNFLAYWDNIAETLLGAPSFPAWAERLYKEFGFRILCYDCYSQMNPEEEGVHTYFKCLRNFSEAADASGIEPWTTLLSVGHFRYRVPNEDDLRWQLNTAAACGMRGVLWFFLYERAPIANYRLPPIDEFGERTETYTRMSRVNRHFLHRYGDFFLRAHHIATYHVVKSYGGYPLFEEGKSDDLLLSVSSEQDLPGIVGLFELDGHKHAAVVNNSVTQPGEFRVHVPKNAEAPKRLNWQGGFEATNVACQDAHYSETETERIGGDWLAPGQLMVYRLD